ncbi:MAG: A/G-specific adenine glycosylase [Erysipelotrichaceae bacterium]
MEKITVLLESWYLENRRDLPFRTSREAYPVWVSEIMAQQTRIDTMLPYFARWMQRWPTIGSLAEAEIQDVLKMWEGLGYYNRARNLHQGAKVIVERFEGIFPSTYADILDLPGIGPYTAAAIASIVYDEKVPAIDGNVLRVISRLLMMYDEISTASAKAIVHEAMTDWMDEARPHIFTQAMMELGALVCTPTTPDCMHCPLNAHCLAYQNGQSIDFPVKKTKAQVPVEYYDCYLLYDADGNIALSDRSDDGLMEGYFRFPVASQLQGMEIRDPQFLGSQKHVYSHKIWETRYYSAKINEVTDVFRWVSEADLQELPLIGAHRKFYQKQKACNE